MGHDVLARAADKVWASRDVSCPPSSLVALLLEYLLTAPAVQCRVTPQQAAELAVRWFPRAAPLLWLRAQMSFSAGDYDAAGRLLETLVSMGTTGDYDRSVSFDPRIIGDDAILNLGVCHTRLGDIDKAEACFRKLANSPTRGAEARANIEALRTLKMR